MTPGELIEPGYNTETSDRNIAREAQNINDENDHATTRKSPMEPAGTNPSTELHHLGDSHVDSVTNNTTGSNTLYEGNVRSQEKSRPGDLNSAPRGQAKRGLGDFSSENIAQEIKDVDTTSPESQAYGGTTSRSGYNRDHINIVASPGETGRYNTATIADFNGNISLKNISPRREGEIKNLSQQREEISRASDGGANVVPSSTNSDSYVGGAPVSAGRSSDGANIAQEAQNVNEVDKLGNVLAYDISGIRKSTGRGLDGSAISADALDQSIDNSSIPNNPQDVNDENSHITCSMESTEANQYNTKKNELKSSWNRAEGQFNDQTRLNLHHSQYSSNTIV